MEFDPMSIAVAGVPLMILVFGLVELIKAVTGLSGKWVTVLSFCLGVGLTLLYFFVPEPIIKIVVTCLVVGLAASGFYKFSSSRLPKQE